MTTNEYAEAIARTLAQTAPIEHLADGNWRIELESLRASIDGWRGLTEEQARHEAIPHIVEMLNGKVRVRTEKQLRDVQRRT